MSASTAAKAFVRRHVNGALWQRPSVKRVLPLVDRADLAVRRRAHLDDLPPFSMRIRSNGMEHQFGGERFARLGAVIADDLVRHAGLNAKSRVLDIGCGVGRGAVALKRLYPDLDYTGMDLDLPSVEACRANPNLRGYRFITADVQSELYNAGGTLSAEDYRLPFADGSLDVVYLISVFTHMYAAQARHYAGEITRVLSPEGRCAVSTHLIEGSTEGWTEMDGMHTRFPATPQKMIGHTPAQIEAIFGRPARHVVYGGWRGSVPGGDRLVHEFSQDLLVFGRT